MSYVKRYWPLLWINLIPILSIVYTFLNHDRPSVRMLWAELDKHIPLMPIFILPYDSWYPFLLSKFIWLFLKEKETYFKTLTIMCIGLIICYLIYSVFQTTIARPQLTEQGIFNDMIRFVYNHDQPYNCFPSIHVLTSYIVLKGAKQCAGIQGAAFAIVAVLYFSIIISTIFIKQHVILDVIGAIVLVEVLYLMAFVFQVISSQKKMLKVS
ncbi:inositol phosphorylceramide synthase [Paenibacillus sp. LMG 31460]|uniref:Inositol phosphorylceramide synthase n=1 Tax=Paenibacillus germinis TaxID=2654979 RepID=A0ABX1Z337_9BACL|nr:phosphatase PAP2 family protein [Paenibacillus germinis]NOU86348.1 inositol phosphorylceramide synthase [Paenibacillus germinis]